MQGLTEAFGYNNSHNCWSNLFCMYICFSRKQTCFSKV